MSEIETPPARGVLNPARIVALIVAVLAAVLGVYGAGSEPSRPDPTTPKVTTLAPAVKIDADRSSDNEPAGPSVAAHEDQRDEHPEGVSPAAVAEGLAQTTAPGLTAPQPVGGAQNYSCKYKPVVNQSQRPPGVKAQLVVLHYTVSRPGSLLAIWRLFNTPSFQASSTFLMEFSGECLRLMSPSAKPWTQGTFNGRSISLEIIAMGTETRAQWLAAPIFSRRILASWLVDTSRGAGIPRRFVDPQGCGVQASGYTDHNHLECGNSHTDVAPNFPFDVLRAQVADLERLTIAEAGKRGDVCNKLKHHRAEFARERPGTREWEARRVKIRALRSQAAKLGLDDRRCRR